MGKINKIILSIVIAAMLLLSTVPALTAYATVAVNPSSQMHNQGVIPTYIEGSAMHDLGRRLSYALHRRDIGAEVFWSGRGDYIGGLIMEVNGANAYDAKSFISLHSDSAGPDKSNTLLILYVSPAGREMAEKVGGYVADKMDLKLELRYRSNLYVLNASRMPAILMEILNHSNTADCMRLLDKNYRAAMADAIADGYLHYLNKSAPVPTPAPLPVVRIPKSARADYRVLRIGDQGASVAALQIKLQQKGHDLDVDGDFGPMTENQVIWFQEDHNLFVDGVVGAKTWRSLNDPRTTPRIISLGQTGRAVVMLQQRFAILRAGWHVAIDGDFGPHTDTAVRIYQRQTNLVEDGVVGEKTWRKLLW